MRIVLRVILAAVAVVALLVFVTVIAFRTSPWPGVLLIRATFGQGAEAANDALGARVPQGIIERTGLAYGTDPDERLDLYLPPGAPPPQGWPVLVWVHGGAFVSGDRGDVANYLKILAARGYATIAPGYTLAPSARHPRPTEQMLEALYWLEAAAADHALDPARITLAGDSAGAHVALQTAIAIHDPDYAATLGLRPRTDPGRLRAVALFCGVYDLHGMDMDGGFGGFLRTVLWAYLGTRDASQAHDAALFSLFANLPPDLPPLFITGGNADPLLPQSTALADEARARGIPTDMLFFPADHAPPLAHEFQFTLDAAGEEVLSRLAAFLDRHAR